MENNKYLTTPEGKAIYPYLTHPDTEFKSEGLYHTKLECDQKDCQNLIKKIDDIVAQQANYNTINHQRNQLRKHHYLTKKLMMVKLSLTSNSMRVGPEKMMVKLSFKNQ